MVAIGADGPLIHENFNCLENFDVEPFTFIPICATKNSIAVRCPIWIIVSQKSKCSWEARIIG